MAKLKRVQQIMEMSGIDTLTVVSIPTNSDLLRVSRDFFPPFFKGWCAATTDLIPEIYGIEEVELDEAYEALDTIWLSRASFAIENCPLEMVQRFCLALEARNNTKPDSENELFVFHITRENGTSVAKRTIVADVRSIFPELPSQHLTTSQASI
jgi:hypothetical protein